MSRWWPFKKKQQKWTPEQEENFLRFAEQFAGLYHKSVERYGDDGHDQFVEVTRQSLKGEDVLFVVEHAKQEAIDIAADYDPFEDLQKSGGLPESQALKGDNDG